MFKPIPARALDTMSTQVQGLSDNLEEIKSRLGKLNQQLVDPPELRAKSRRQNFRRRCARLRPTGPRYAHFLHRFPETPPAPRPAPPPFPPARPRGHALFQRPTGHQPAAKYDLARSEFEDYLKFYSDTDLASNAQFYLGEIFYKQSSTPTLSPPTTKSSPTIPRASNSVPLASQRHWPSSSSARKPPASANYATSSKRYPGSDEDRLARAKLKELGVSVTATVNSPAPALSPVVATLRRHLSPALLSTARSSFRPQGEISLRSWSF